MELKIIEFLCGIKLGTSDDLMLVSEHHRPLTCTHHSTGSGKRLWQSVSSRLRASLLGNSSWIKRIPHFFQMHFLWWITPSIQKYVNDMFGFCLVLFHFRYWLLVLVSFFCTKLNMSLMPSIFLVMDHYKLWPMLNLLNLETELRVFLGHGTTDI